MSPKRVWSPQNPRFLAMLPATIDNYLTQVINSPQYHDILSILKGFRNGLVYGAKIRAPHAFVMTFLFRTGSFYDKLRAIFKATFQHSRNLAMFVTIYKTLMVIFKKLKNKESNGDSFLAGLVGGYIVFGEDNNINQQIVLYLFSRILIGLAKVGVQNRVLSAPNNTFTMFAATVWGIVMWLFRHHRSSLQGSLQASMQYLYNDSEVFSNIRNLLWHNI